MADARLEILRRTWLASGRVEDEVALLREQLRTGDLERERLELAAYCLQPAAGLVAGGAAPPQRFGLWVKLLDYAGHSTRVCVALGALRGPPVRLGRGRQRIGPAARAVLQAGEAWLRDPSELHAGAVDRGRQRAQAELDAHPFNHPRRVDLRLATEIAELIAQGVQHTVLLSASLRWFLQGCQERLVATQVSRTRDQSARATELRRNAERRLLRRVQRYVAQWALRRI